MTDMELSSMRSLNSLSVVSNISSGIHFFEDIFFWERLKFDWVSNLNSFNDFAFTFLDDDPDVLLMAHSDMNILQHLLSHWRDLAGRHPDVERLTAAEYKFLYYDSLKCSSNMWEFLQLELMRTDGDGLAPGRGVMRRSHSYPQTAPATRARRYRSVAVLSDQQRGQQHSQQHQHRHANQPQRHRHRSADSSDNGSDHTADRASSAASVAPEAAGTAPDAATMEFVNLFAGLNQNLALYLLIEGPKTIPPQFRNVYKNLIQILCKTHGSFLPTIMQMKKDDRLRPIEYEGYWESDSTCHVCFQTHGAFIKRCCDVVVCESCFTQYINHQIHSLNRIHVECPATNCQRPIRFQSIWIRLSESNRKIYERIKNNQLQTETRKLCPHCMQFYELSEEEKERLSKKKLKKLHKKGFNVRCQMCQWEWCFKCQTPMHNVTCKKNVSTDKLLMKWANSRAESLQSSVKKARKCPKCHILVERNGGCPHMECAKCKCSWCYDCGHRRIKIKHFPFVNHDSRFFILGCSKNLLANKPHLRRFVRICVFCGVSILIIPASAVAGVLLVALGILLGLPFGCYMLAVKMRQCSCSK